MYNTDEAIKKTLRDIEEMEAANKALPEIKKVIEKWDGKVINKRFGADLESAGIPGNIYLGTYHENSYEICYRPENGHKWFTVLFGTRPSCQYYVKEKSFVDPDKRISAERSFQLLEAGRVDRLKTITAYKEHLATWEQKKAQMEMLKKQLRTLADSIPYTMQDYFNMHVKYY